MRLVRKSGIFHSEDESIVELTLSLPGTTTTTTTSRATKRGFMDAVDLYLSNSSSTTTTTSTDDSQDELVPSPTQSPIPKAQMLGWPPVRANRKNAMMMRKSGWKYVKVAVDGAPYLRKVDLEMYDSYEELLAALETLFPSLTIRNHLNERKLMDIANGMEYLPTYEDKDGDWMLVGDVPWEMFVESCKKIRLVIR